MREKGRHPILFYSKCRPSARCNRPKTPSSECFLFSFCFRRVGDKSLGRRKQIKRLRRMGGKQPWGINLIFSITFDLIARSLARSLSHTAHSLKTCAVFLLPPAGLSVQASPRSSIIPFITFVVAPLSSRLCRLHSTALSLCTCVSRREALASPSFDWCRLPVVMKRRTRKNMYTLSLIWVFVVCVEPLEVARVVYLFLYDVLCLTCVCLFVCLCVCACRWGWRGE